LKLIETLSNLYFILHDHWIIQLLLLPAVSHHIWSKSVEHFKSSITVETKLA